MISRPMIDQIHTLLNSGSSIRKITQSLGLSRNTVRRYIRQAKQEDKKQQAQVETFSNEKPSAWQDALDWVKLVKERKCGVTAQQL